MLVSPLFRNMSMHFPLLLRECVVTASALQGDREGIVPSRSGESGGHQLDPNITRTYIDGVIRRNAAHPFQPRGEFHLILA
jgi:hypothetical protein